MSNDSGKWKGIRIYSQNVYRKYNWVQTLLNSSSNLYDIFLFQEPPWAHIKNVASMEYWEGTPVTGMPSHPDYTCLYHTMAGSKSRTFDVDGSRPRVAAYVHKNLSSMKPKLRSDILIHRDILIITLTRPEGCVNIMNVYSDSSGTSIRVLSDHVNLPRIDYMGGDFNCPSRHWDLSMNHFTPLAETLSRFAEENGLIYMLNDRKTHSPFNGSRPSILDLVFLCLVDNDSYIKIGNRGESDHHPIITYFNFPLFSENRPPNIPTNSEEESKFVADVVESLSSIPIPGTRSQESIIHVVKMIRDCIKSAWDSHAISPRSSYQAKSWWDESCAAAWTIYRTSDGTDSDWKDFCKVTKQAKR